jgi:transcriptional regulator with XRE-family HTH domain
VGINRNYIGMIERGENSPTLSMLERLAKAHNVKSTRFFDE